MTTGRASAVVTGATGGMGAEIVRELSDTHEVLAVGRDADALRALADETGCRTSVADLTTDEGIRTVSEACDRVDVLVHAAALGGAVGVAGADADLWRTYLDTNVVAPALLTRSLLPLVRERQGTIVFIGSGASTKPVPGSAVYTATKHALKGLADVLRIDEASARVRVVTLSPGQTDTPMLRRSIAPEQYSPERYIRPRSIAETVRFVVDAPPDVHLTDIAVRPRVEIARL